MGGKTSNESKAKYNAKAYDRINIAVPKGRKDEIQAIAEQRGQSINAYINTIIEEALAKAKAQ
ncbi:MAG: Arc family DNA-binding protein [Ruminococcus sp.]|nr:Arc family DNA-binding protein [Ruminococcus sp.]